MKRVQKSKESESTPSIGSKIKTFLIKTFFVALVIGVAFGAGTFKPNTNQSSKKVFNFSLLPMKVPITDPMIIAIINEMKTRFKVIKV